MKLTTTHPKAYWKTAAFAVAGLLFAIVPPVQAEEITFQLKRDTDERARASRTEGRRLPAITRIRRGFTPYVFEGRNGALYRHDDLTSNVLALHTRRISRKVRLRAGHSLAPNVAKIVER